MDAYVALVLEKNTTYTPYKSPHICKDPIIAYNPFLLLRRRCVEIPLSQEITHQRGKRQYLLFRPASPPMTTNNDYNPSPYSILPRFFSLVVPVEYWLPQVPNIPRLFSQYFWMAVAPPIFVANKN